MTGWREGGGNKLNRNVKCEDPMLDTGNKIWFVGWGAGVLLVTVAVVGCVKGRVPGSNGLISGGAPIARSNLAGQDWSDDIRDILPIADGFVVATGKGVARYGWDGNRPHLSADYTVAEGLPSDETRALRCDADGGLWVLCKAGVGWLPRGGTKWQAFTEINGLATGEPNCMALSAGGDRVWVSSPGGLASALVKDRRWRSWPALQPFDIFVHPSADTVWCRRKIPTACEGCTGVQISQFDLSTARWHDLPEPEIRTEDSAPKPVYFSTRSNRLWCNNGGAPPLVYDPLSDKITTWASTPNWERIEDGHQIVYDDAFGEMLPAADDHGHQWFATLAGFWEYDEVTDRWTIHRKTDNLYIGHTLAVRSLDGKTCYWAGEVGLDNSELAAYDVVRRQWVLLWTVKKIFGEQMAIEQLLLPDGKCISSEHREIQPQLALSPDGSNLWWFGLGGIFVGNPVTRQSVLLTDKDVPGLTRASSVRFDAVRGVALIATPRGVVIADYSGRLRFLIQRSLCPITDDVTRFVFAHDGDEVWCLQDRGVNQRSAAVYHPSRREWEAVPNPRTGQRVYDVILSPSNRTTWLSVTPTNSNDRGLLQRLGRGEWTPIRANMPSYYSNISAFWMTPKGDDLWLNADGNGLLRISLASGRVSQYVKSECCRENVEEIHGLAGDYATQLAFTPDGSNALCFAGGGMDRGLTLINLKTGSALNYAVPMPVENIGISPDGCTAWCILNNSQLWAFDMRQQKWTIQLSPGRDIPMTHLNFDALLFSAGGRYLWVSDGDEVAAYRVADNTWKVFRKKGLESWSKPSLLLASDGESVVCGHERGLAVLSGEGAMAVLDAEPGRVTHLIRLPGKGSILCTVATPRLTRLYKLEPGENQLRRFHEFPGLTTALAVGPDNRVWVGLRGGVLCLDPTTGQEVDIAGDSPASVVQAIAVQEMSSDRVISDPMPMR